MNKYGYDETQEEKMIRDNLFNLEPGPGYYDIYDTRTIGAKIEKNKLKNKLNYFGSTAKRDCSLITKDQELSPGPGLYYNRFKPVQKPKKLILTRKENNDILNAFKIQREIHKINLGPGTYESNSIFDNIKKETYVGPYQIRFPDIDSKRPGPGSYLKLPEWAKKNDFGPIRKTEDRRLRFTKYSTPGVGSYRDDMVGSIKYRVQSKSNLLQSLIAPFNSSAERTFHKSKSTSSLIGPGPGSYNINLYNNAMKASPEKKIIKVKPIAEWVEQKEEDKARVGPGSYLKYDYNDWNKKSFNILYV